MQAILHGLEPRKICPLGQEEKNREQDEHNPGKFLSGWAAESCRRRAECDDETVMMHGLTSDGHGDFLLQAGLVLLYIPYVYLVYGVGRY